MPTSCEPTKLKTVLFSIATLIWVSAIAAGAVFLSRYSNTPGVAAAKKLFWPSTSAIGMNSAKPTLLVFAHPQCPCSTASISELERLMPFLQDKVQVAVVFTQPTGRSPAWVQSSLWEKAKVIPGVEIVMDSNYRETDLFGAKTSGQVILYDTDGSLVFSGGITPARGHMGDSTGREFILSWLNGEPKQMQITKVFGCALKEMGPMQEAHAHKEER